MQWNPVNSSLRLAWFERPNWHSDKLSFSQRTSCRSQHFANPEILKIFADESTQNIADSIGLNNQESLGTKILYTGLWELTGCMGWKLWQDRWASIKFALEFGHPNGFQGRGKRWWQKIGELPCQCLASECLSNQPWGNFDICSQ